MSDGFGWLEKDRRLQQRDLERAYGHAKRTAEGQAPPVRLVQEPVRTILNSIGGRKIPAHAGATLDDINPATGQRIATIPRSKAADADQAVHAARKAQPAWAATSLAERCRILRRAADLIQERREQLAYLESIDTGKPIGLARNLDIPRSALNFRHFADLAVSETREEHPMPGHTNHTLRDPVGVVALVTPWNLPLYLLSWKVAPALAMGNAIVAKPSELTPLTADALADILADAGLPDGVFNVLHGLGPEAGQPLLEHPAVRAISFTGGTATGRIVAATAAAGLKKCSLELGGKNPALVFADCDLDATVRGVARAAFTNTGQICLCASRILVEASIAPDFTRRLTQHVASLRVGDPLDAATDVGALVSHAHKTKVQGYLDAARQQGANLLCGGTTPDLPAPWNQGAYLQPTLLDGLPQTSNCIQDEIFGPIATIQTFTTEQQAIQLANDVRYGLAATIWTTDPAKAERISAALQTGMVWINCWLVRNLNVPFGGVKESGIGREGGHHSLDFFSEPKNVCVKM